MALCVFIVSGSFAFDLASESQDVRNALSCAGLVESDLNFKKDLYRDDNLSPLVKTLLSKPLETFNFVRQLEAELKGDFWIAKNQKRNRAISVPVEIDPEMRVILESFLGGLVDREKRLSHLLGKGSLDERRRGLECLAVETFHLEQDQTSLKRWGKRMGSPERLKKLVDESRDFQVSDWDVAEAQLKVGQSINPVMLRGEIAECLGEIDEFVRMSKEIIRTKPDQFQFDKLRFDSPLGRVVLGGMGAQNYRAGEADIIIDFGGDDLFEGAGCANGLTGKSFSLVIDLSGNDRYREGASGIWGVGIIWDEQGDDEYEGTDVAFGAGVFGAGVLIDRKGNDRYRSDTMGQGAAAFGYGLLWDGGGDDRYDVALCGQGFAGVNGLGILADISGNDEYKAGGKYPDFDRLPNHYLSLSQGFSIGLRPYAPGGVGILYDQKGNDRYTADIFGQGSSYWYACGVLIDGAGDDHYKAYQYDQGTGIHLSVGILKDGGGNDVYLSESGLAQAGPHDLAVGLLWDCGGNDSYTAESASQGCAINNSVGILYDENGDDCYKITKPKHANGQGRGEYADTRGFGSVGVLVDLAGHDQYSHDQCDDHVAVRESIGVAVDFSNRFILNEWKKVWSKPSKEYQAPSFSELSSKFKSVSRVKEGGIFNQKEFAFGSLVTGVPAGIHRSLVDIQKTGGDPKYGLLLAQAGRYGDVPWKVEQRKRAGKQLEVLSVEELESVYPWIVQGIESRIKMENLIAKKGDEARSLLRKFSQHDWYELRSLAVYMMMQNKAKSEDVFYALKALSDERTRTNALVMLSKGGGSSYEKEVRPFLQSDRVMDRALSIKILSKSLSDKELFQFLEDPDWNVRNESAKVLKKRGKWDKSFEKNLSALGSYWLMKHD